MHVNELILSFLPRCTIYVYDIVHHLRFVGSGRSALLGAFSKQLMNSSNCDLQQIIYYEQNLNNTSKLPHKQ